MSFIRLAHSVPERNEYIVSLPTVEFKSPWTLFEERLIYSKNDMPGLEIEEAT